MNASENLIGVRGPDPRRMGSTGLVPKYEYDASPQDFGDEWPKTYALAWGPGALRPATHGTVEAESLVRPAYGVSGRGEVDAHFSDAGVLSTAFLRAQGMNRKGIQHLQRLLTTYSYGFAEQAMKCCFYAKNRSELLGSVLIAFSGMMTQATKTVFHNETHHLSLQNFNMHIDNALLQKQLGAAQAENAKVTRKMEIMEQDMRNVLEVEKGMHLERAKFRTHLAEANVHATRNDEELVQLRYQTKQLKASLEESETKLQETQIESSQAQAAAAQAQGRAEEAEARVVMLEGVVSELESETGRLHRILPETEQKVQVAHTKLDETDKALQSTREELQEAIAKIKYNHLDHGRAKVLLLLDLEFNKSLVAEAQRRAHDFKRILDKMRSNTVLKSTNTIGMLTEDVAVHQRALVKTEACLERVEKELAASLAEHAECVLRAERDAAEAARARVELENRLERAELRVTQQQNRVAATEAKLEKKRAKKKAYKAQLLEHSKQAHAMKLRSATMKISEGKLQRQLEREKAALDSKIASAVSEASKGHEELEEDLERVKEELAEMKKKFNDSRQREKEQAKIYSNLEAEVKALGAQMERAQQEHDATQSSLSSELDQLTQQLKASQDDAQEKQKRITLLQEQIEEANLQTMEAMEQKHESQAKANKYLGENNLLKDEKTKLEEEIDRLNSLPPPDESAKERVIELEGELEQINAKVEELTAELQTQTELSEGYETELARLREERSQQVEELAHLQLAANALESQADARRKQLRLVLRWIDAMRASGEARVRDATIVVASLSKHTQHAAVYACPLEVSSGSVHPAGSSAMQDSEMFESNVPFHNPTEEEREMSGKIDEPDSQQHTMTVVRGMRRAASALKRSNVQERASEKVQALAGMMANLNDALETVAIKEAMENEGDPAVKHRYLTPGSASGLHLQVQSMQSAAATSPDMALDEDAARTHQDGSKERLEEPDLPDDESLDALLQQLGRIWDPMMSSMEQLECEARRAISDAESAYAALGCAALKATELEEQLNATKALSVDDKTFQIQPEVMEFQAQVPEEPVRCVDAQVQCGDGAPVQDQGKQNDVCTTAECESRGSQTNVSGAISAGGEEEVEPAFVREKWTLSKFSSLTQRINDLVAGLKPTQPIPRDVIGDLEEIALEHDMLKSEMYDSGIVEPDLASAGQLMASSLTQLVDSALAQDDARSVVSSADSLQEPQKKEIAESKASISSSAPTSMGLVDSTVGSSQDTNKQECRPNQPPGGNQTQSDAYQAENMHHRGTPTSEGGMRDKATSYHETTMHDKATSNHGGSMHDKSISNCAGSMHDKSISNCAGSVRDQATSQHVAVCDDATSMHGEFCQDDSTSYHDWDTRSNEDPDLDPASFPLVERHPGECRKCESTRSSLMGSLDHVVREYRKLQREHQVLLQQQAYFGGFQGEGRRPQSGPAEVMAASVLAPLSGASYNNLALVTPNAPPAKGRGRFHHANVSRPHKVGNWVGNKNDLGGNHQRALSAGAYTGSALPVAEHQPTDPGLPRLHQDSGRPSSVSVTRLERGARPKNVRGAQSARAGVTNQSVSQHCHPMWLPVKPSDSEEICDNQVAVDQVSNPLTHMGDAPGARKRVVSAAAATRSGSSFPPQHIALMTSINERKTRQVVNTRLSSISRGRR